MSERLHRRLDKLRQPDTVRERRILEILPHESETQAFNRQGFDPDEQGVEYVKIKFVVPPDYDDGAAT